MVRKSLKILVPTSRTKKFYLRLRKIENVVMQVDVESIGQGAINTNFGISFG